MRDVVVRKTVAWLRWVSGSTWFLLAAVALVAGGLLLSVPWSAVAAWSVDLLRAWGSAGPVTLAGAFLLLVVVIQRMVTRVRSGDRAAGRRASVRPIPMWGIWLGAVVVVLVGVLAAAALMMVFGSGTAEDKIRLEAIKLAGTIALGTGGGAALLLTARRQRTTEVDLLQKGHDADERRITELYTAAAQQLASDKAPVRMAGLYALERLGQSSPEHQQTIVNLFCAYLRMPETSGPSKGSASPEFQEEAVSEEVQQDGARQPLLLDLAPTLAEAAGLSLDAAEQQQQERQVRLTVQGLLAQHLRPDPDEQGQPTNPNFWGGKDGSGLDLDLSKSILHSWNFRRCCVRTASFNGASFYGIASFDGAQFLKGTGFVQARFYDYVSFGGAQFFGGAAFRGSDFHYGVRFEDTQFRSLAMFNGARLHDHAWFEGAQFHDAVWFCGAQFRDTAWLKRAQFHGWVDFERTQFHDHVRFHGAQFRDRVSFKGAQFHSRVRFEEAQFCETAQFERAWMRLDVRFSPLLEVAAPRGWMIIPVDSGEDRSGQWGELVPEVDEGANTEGSASAVSEE